MIPTQCLLWQKEQPTADDLKVFDRFDILNTFEEDSHLTRRLLRCKECGQLYFYEFYEEIDWVAGNDPQYLTYIPVASAEEAEQIAALPLYELLRFTPRLQRDWPSNAKSPTITWIR